MASKLTGKQRAARIPLDYFKKRDKLSRWKLGLSGLALVGVVVWMASGFSLGGPLGIHENDRGRMMASHGPVARVHAVWDAKCEACHTPFTSIDGQAWAANIGLKSGDPSKRCISCHAVEDHSKNMKANEVEACASCHRDHQGRDFDLLDIADSSCINCHGDLKNHLVTEGRPKPKGIDDKVVGFPTGHPEFKPFPSDGSKKTSDPGTIKFSHLAHMMPGQNKTPGGKPLQLYSELADADKAMYVKDGDGVKLECKSCHHLDSSASYFLPVTYQQDCKACHVLKVAMGSSTIDVPHKLQPAVIEAFLKNEAIGEVMKAKETPSSAKAPARALPGRSPAVLSALPDPLEVAKYVKDAEKNLFATQKVVENKTLGNKNCAECHEYTLKEGQLAPEMIAKNGMNEFWFPNARFDHAAHRGLSCVSCHEGADPKADPTKTGKASDSHKDVLLVGMKTCVQCHGPETTSDKGLPLGGAGTKCVECHKYHGGGHGGAKNVIEGTRGIEEFLSASSKAAPSSKETDEKATATQSK